jgi:hypothetical protein
LIHNPRVLPSSGRPSCSWAATHHIIRRSTMSIDITISVDENINDPLSMGQTHIVSEVFRIANEVLINGGKVIVQRVYTNAEPDQLCVFKSEAELRGWKDRLNDVQIKLGREHIS